MYTQVFPKYFFNISDTFSYVCTPYSINNNNNLSPLHVAVLNITNYECVIWNSFQNLVTNIHGMLMSLNVAKMLNPGVVA